jgi:hypothetical protein
MTATIAARLVQDSSMTRKKLAEVWCAEAALGGFKPVWWKQIYIWAVFKISPPRLPEISN